MKKRQIEILKFILQNGAFSVDQLIERFSVSKRTIYYDIEDINNEIKEYGKIENINKKYIYLGSDDIFSKFEVKAYFTNNIDDRQQYIIEKLFLDEFTTIDEISENLLVSRNTIVNDINDIKNNLINYGISLIYDKKYELKSEEYKIRDFYITSMYQDQNLLLHFDNRIKEINEKAKLYLTDYSLALLSKYIKFVDKRLIHGKFIEPYKIYDDTSNFQYFNIVKDTLKIENENEIKHIVALIASMTNLKIDKINQQIENFVDKLIYNFERLAFVEIKNKKEFKREISRHLQSSYYRLKYKFPIYNSMLLDLKNNYASLLKLIKDSIYSTNDKLFQDIRESEVAFLAMYFGSRIDTFYNINNRVVIVCPNGKVVSKLLESQLKNYLPTLNIKAIASIHELKELEGSFDYIISTIPIENYDNVIIVKPILTKYNLSELYDIFLDIDSTINEKNISEIIEIIKENSKNFDEIKLKNDLIDYFIRNKQNGTKKEGKNLSGILTRDRVKKIKKIKNWKEAIKIASQVLIDNNSIKFKYVEDMIKQAEIFGPYMVIVDKVAMPHAQNLNSVNKLDLSILSLEEAVDMLGKEVNLFIIISTVDNNSHLDVISTLTDILSNIENISILNSGNYIKIKNLVEKYERIKYEN
ncbi:BglG family transcription antiterminator [Helcococcus bovis]|uniref:BglG family transcription antiterminator n=1 Tax=Helcococcus bovis TaxID=3153252 RepID=UPI0038BDD900